MGENVGVHGEGDEIAELVGAGLSWGWIGFWLFGHAPTDGLGASFDAPHSEMVGGNPPRTAHHLAFSPPPAAPCDGDDAAPEGRIVRIDEPGRAGRPDRQRP